MANAYSAPDFNIDTSTNVAGLTALKGSAPASTDNIYIYNGARLTVEGALAILKIKLGQTSAGAASAGQRYGKITVDAGQTVTFTGAPSYADSGLFVVPTSADASSKDCEIDIPGTSGSHAVFTNSAGAYSTDFEYILDIRYGYVDIDYLDYSWHGWAAPFYIDMLSANSNASEWNINHITLEGAYATSMYIFYVINDNSDIPLNATYGTLKLDYNARSYYLLSQNAQYAAAGWERDLSNWKIELNGISYAGFHGFSNLRLSTSGLQTIYSGPVMYDESDIRGTEVVPTTFAVGDAASSGDLIFTWANGASYATGEDWVHIYDNSDDSEIGVVDASLGTFELGGFTDGVAFTAYAKASSDGKHFSAATATDSGTPTAGAAAPTFAGLADAPTDLGNGRVRLSWIQATGTGADHYEIIVHTADPSKAEQEAGTYTVGYVVDAGATYEFDVCLLVDNTHLIGGTEYHFAVKAWNANGGDYDASDSVQTLTPTTTKEVDGPHIVPTPQDPAYIVGTNQGTATALITCGAGVKLEGRIRIANNNSAAEDVTLYHVPSGESIDAEYIILPAFTLQASGNIDASDDNTEILLNAGDKIYAFSTTTNKVILSLVAALQVTIE